MNDKEAFQQFYKQISWADECKEIDLGDRIVCKTAVSLILPSHVDFETVLSNAFSIKCLAAALNLEPMLLIWGEATREAVEKICFELAQQKIAMDWLDVSNKLYYSHFLTSALDGIDWQRSIEVKSQDGMSVKPVWQWDED